MLIYAVKNGYESGPVFTNFNGRKVWVSDGYAASTREEIVKLACMNASIRLGVCALAQHKTV